MMKTTTTLAGVEFYQSNHRQPYDQGNSLGRPMLHDRRLSSTSTIQVPPPIGNSSPVGGTQGSDAEGLKGSDEPRSNAGSLVEFFHPDVFQAVLYNPATSKQLWRFCEKQYAGENMAFLTKIDRFNNTMDELDRLMGDIYGEFVRSGAPQQINISEPMRDKIARNLHVAFEDIRPHMLSLFTDSQKHIEQLLLNDVYPRFVKHQINLSASRALAQDSRNYQGLGDCFCLTDSKKADDPIAFASDGFQLVTGYDRSEAIDKNCRFLQGSHTDNNAVRRLRVDLDSHKESVKLLLNYRKDGQPFWNLLFVAPLMDASSEIIYYLGAQMNCSTTIHSSSDILRILALSEPEDNGNSNNSNGLRRRPGMPEKKTDNGASPSLRERLGIGLGGKTGRAWSPGSSANVSRSGSPPRAPNGDKVPVGLEGSLVNALGDMTLKDQAKAFYTVYSKFLILSYHPSMTLTSSDTHQHLTIAFHSPSVLSILPPVTPPVIPSASPLIGQDVFRALARISHVSDRFRTNVRKALKTGFAVSEDLAPEDTKVPFTHWTPLKDKAGSVRWVVLILSEKGGKLGTVAGG